MAMDVPGLSRPGISGGASGSSPLGTLLSGPGSRSALGAHLRGYLLMLRFDFASQRPWLAFSVAMQILIGAGMAVIYGFYVPHLPKRSLLFLVTGAPALALIPVGLLMVPMFVSQQKTEGTFDFIWSLPVPRVVSAASSLTVFTLVALPGCAMTILLAAWRYNVGLTVSPSIVPAVILTSLMTASIGTALAHGVKDPMVTNMITNALLFVVLLFSPIAFPKSQFPTWLANVHEVLPLYHIGVVIRDGLSTGLVSDAWLSYLILAAWTCVGWAVTALIIGRRG